jgi:hypothetical protein
MTAIVAVTGTGGVVLLVGAGLAGLSFGMILNTFMGGRRKK